MGLLMLGYIAYDVSKITKSAQFIDMKEASVQTNYALFYGYQLLIDLIGLV